MGINSMLPEKITNALYMIDIGQSFVLANANAEGVVRDLKKLIPEAHAIRDWLAELPAISLEDGSARRGSLWQAKDGSAHRVMGMANLSSERQDDYPVMVFHFDANRKREEEVEVLSTPLEIWQQTHHLVALQSHEVTRERMLALLDEIESDIQAAVEQDYDFFDLRAAAHRLRRPINALQEGWGEVAALCFPEGELATGSTWRHYNGNRYTVIGCAEKGNRVVYRGDNGHVWTRTLSDWHRSMSPSDPIEIKRSIFGDRTFG